MQFAIVMIVKVNLVFCRSPLLKCDLRCSNTFVNILKVKQINIPKMQEPSNHVNTTLSCSYWILQGHVRMNWYKLL